LGIFRLSPLQCKSLSPDYPAAADKKYLGISRIPVFGKGDNVLFSLDGSRQLLPVDNLFYGSYLVSQ
jgi:hypothetical protein